jgi:hypothetical protein
MGGLAALCNGGVEWPELPGLAVLFHHEEGACRGGSLLRDPETGHAVQAARAEVLQMLHESLQTRTGVFVGEAQVHVEDPRPTVGEHLPGPSGVQQGCAPLSPADAVWPEPDQLAERLLNDRVAPEVHLRVLRRRAPLMDIHGSHHVTP